MPGKRIEQLAMADNWVSTCTGNLTEWGIPAASFAELSARRSVAWSALNVSLNASTRTPVTNAHSRIVCKELEDFMRGFKRRYFLCPPLTDADLLNLGLKPADAARTCVNPPDTAPDFTVSQRGPGALAIVFRNGAGAKPGSKPKGVAEVRIYYALSDVPITNQEALFHSKGATRCPCIIRFPESDRGKRAYFALKWETGKQDGESYWSEIRSELVS
jgi:hypothetical protein